ncbi:MAG TPA: methyltransferase domain-containing protein [Dehalococcoidia bacterium]|nr:methyltransferase domain-containing protein [Dehalococcoidia bacterium]
MPRDKHATVRKMTQRYGIAASEASRAVERRVIGANFGTNGYTTLPQARALIKTLRLGPGVRLLDVGAGRGWPGLYLAQATGCETVLSDVPMTALRIALAQRDALGLTALVSICRATGTHLPFQVASFDAVVHTDTL